MTGEQDATVGMLKAHGYRVRVIRYAAHGVLLIKIKRRLTNGDMPLRVYPDGTYTPPEYDAARTHRREVQAWQS